ncbi:ferrous iron transport protein A [Clostridium aestuarii]|uniref:Ferrous iron transport protein A n=1 Tax=Clostridium aestuarii TaxID=338193 RepID=A0ABT4D012_9CLOT|nr:ferrous iron transport protein A [Clostridium aestuarii]MCY6484577.1 ferrous iron transport protein A [Clostridium aestuarii]
MNISDLKPGQEGFIDTVFGNEKLAKRLLALGCIEGTKITLKTSAPFGDPLIIKVRGFNLAIRKKDAQNIKLKMNVQAKTA